MEDLKAAFDRLRCVPWAEFCMELSVIMMMLFFAEHCGYSVDQSFLEDGSGGIRDAFVMASPDQFSEFGHLEQLFWILGQI